MAEQHNHELCPNTVIIKNLRNEIERLRNESAEIRDKVINNEARTTQIFDILGEIKESVKSIAEELHKLQTRPDPFKDQMYKFGLKLAEWALVGGIIYMATQGGTP